MAAELFKRCGWMKSIIVALVLLSFLLPTSSAAQSGLSLAGIDLLQALPFEKSVAFSYKQTKTVLEGIFNLVVKQHGLDTAESRKKYPEYAKGIEGNYKDNELGEVLKRLFLAIPKNVFGMEPTGKNRFLTKLITSA